MALIRRGLLMLDYLARLGTKDTYKAKFEALCVAIDNAHAVDAVEVTRCKDCVHYHHEHGCDVFSWKSSPEDYCSFAETEGTR